MKEEEPVEGKKSEDDGIEKENLAILEKIRKNQRQDHLKVSAHSVRWLFIHSGELGAFLWTCLLNGPCCILILDGYGQIPFDFDIYKFLP